MSILADGSTLSINDGVAAAFVVVPSVIDFTPPSEELAEYDATALDSTAGTMIKKPKSRSEPGTFTWNAFYSSTEYARAKTLQLASKGGTVNSFKLTYPDATIDTIPGFIRKVDIQQAQNQEPMKMAVTVQVTGLVARS